MENTDWSVVKGSTNAPYINNTLLSQGAYAEQYYTYPGVHPSLGNYIWLEAGTNFGIYNDGPPSFNLLSTTNHLVNQLEAAGITWRAYIEGITGTNCPSTDAYPYAVRHIPFLYFSDVLSNETRCISHLRPYLELSRDLISRTNVASYNFIVPDLCNDGHDYCTTNGAVWQMDAWLSQEIPRITNSPAYTNNGAIFILWDEGSFGGAGVQGDGPIPCILLSPLIKAGYANSIPYNHSSTMRTLQEIFNVRPFLADALFANDFADLFHFFALNTLRTTNANELEIQVLGLTPGLRTFVETSGSLPVWSEMTNFVPDRASISLRHQVEKGAGRYFRAYTKP